MARLQARADELPRVQSAAEQAAAHALHMEQAMQARTVELRDAREAAATLELALEETGRDDARDGALRAAMETIALREAESIAHRLELDAARRECSMLADAVTSLSTGDAVR